MLKKADVERVCARAANSAHAQAPALTPVVELEGVHLALVAAKSRRAKLTLDNVSLSIRPGEFCSIVGPSGCGKSTILNLIAGFMQPTTGEVRYHGAPVRGVNKSVGYVTQDDNLLPWRTMQANIELPLELRGVSKRDRAARSHALIERARLSGVEKHYPAELSGGMRKRAAILRTLIYDSDMLLMDEPFGPLDAQTRVVLQGELLSLWELTGSSVLFVTHDLVEAIALSDRIVTMSASPGQIKNVYEVKIPRPRDVYRIHEHPRFPSLYESLWSDIRAEMQSAEVAHDVSEP